MRAKSFRIRRWSRLVLGAALSVFMIPLGWGGSPKLWARASLPAAIRGIRIHFEYDRTRFFPRSWLQPEINCQGSQVQPTEARRAIPLIEQFAAAYGDESLQEHLTDIFLLGSLECYGKTYGGTNSTSAIYLRVGTEAEGYGAYFLLSTLHAEFSSILWREHDFPNEAWLALNPPGFEYSNNPIALLEQAGITEQPSRDLFCGGFLTRYGAADLEDDFNEYAGAIFVEPQELCQYRVKCKAIADKAMLAVQFYKSVDPAIKVSGCGN